MSHSKNALVRWHALNGSTLDEDIESSFTEISFLDNIAVHIKVGAGATGEFFIQGSNVYDETVRGPTEDDWVTIPFVDETGAAVTLETTGSAIQYLCNAINLSFSYLRVIYTFGSGTGTGDVWISGKAI